MALFNHATKELTAKIVYYGPGLCGKTSNLKMLHQRLERGAGKLLSLSTAQDRTIYFDLLPIELGNIKGYTVRFQVCTVPGQVFYNETRKIVLRGVDGLVFVVDSQWSMLSHNLECFQNLKENLHEEKILLESLPVVIQYNKRDLPSALSVEALQDSLGFHSYPFVETVASEGTGVIETFKLVSKLTFVDLLRRLQRGWQPPAEPAADLVEAPAAVVAATPPAPAPEIVAPTPTVAAEEAPVLAVGLERERIREPRGAGGRGRRSLGRPVRGRGVPRPHGRLDRFVHGSRGRTSCRPPSRQRPPRKTSRSRRLSRPRFSWRPSRPRLPRRPRPRHRLLFRRRLRPGCPRSGGRPRWTRSSTPCSRRRASPPGACREHSAVSRLTKGARRRSPRATSRSAAWRT